MFYVIHRFLLGDRLRDAQQIKQKKRDGWEQNWFSEQQNETRFLKDGTPLL